MTETLNALPRGHFLLLQPTERAYVYKTDADGRIDVIDTSINDPRRNISAGSFMGDGDGTVSLLSLGYHCNKVHM